MLVPWKSCLKAWLQQGKMYGPQVMKYQRNVSKGLRTPLITKNLLTSNVGPLRMLAQWRLKAHHCQGLSKAGLVVNKGKVVTHL